MKAASRDDSMKPTQAGFATSCLTALLLSASTASAAGPWSAVINPDNSLSFSFLRDDRPVFHVGLSGWGPKWAWVGLQARQKAEGERLSVRVPFVVNKDKGEVIDVQFEAWQPAARQVAFRYDLEAAKDVPLTLLIAAVNFEPEGSQGTLTLTHAEGKQTEARPARARHPLRPGHVAGRIRLRQGRHGRACSSTRRAPSPSTTPCAWCWRPTCFPRASASVTLTLTFPEDVAFHAKPGRPRQAQPELWPVPTGLPSSRPRRWSRASSTWTAGSTVPPASTAASAWSRMASPSRTARPSSSGASTCPTPPTLPTRRRRTSRPPASPSTASTPCACTSFPTPPARWASAIPTTPRAWTPRGSIGSITSSPS